VKRFWFNYKKVLKDSFNKMPRGDQEAVISKFCTICTLGITVLLLSAFSNILPREIRAPGIPIAPGVAWYLGLRVVSDVMIDRSRFDRLKRSVCSWWKRNCTLIGEFFSVLLSLVFASIVVSLAGHNQLMVLVLAITWHRACGIEWSK
jgi:hypothetical protein